MGLNDSDIIIALFGQEMEYGCFTAPATFPKNVCTYAPSYALFCTFSEVRGNAVRQPSMPVVVSYATEG